MAREARSQGNQKMMKNRNVTRLAGFALFTACACLAMAADVTGKWTMEQGGGGGVPPRISTFEFKVDGNQLTGTLTAPGRGGAAPTVTNITNGKVDGDKITFDVTREMQGNSFTTNYEFTVQGDQMTGKATSPGMGGPQTRDVAAKRVKT
jgi:hypothetical protein